MAREAKATAGTCILKQRLPAFITLQSQSGLLWLELTATTQTLESGPLWVLVCPRLLFFHTGEWGQYCKQLLREVGQRVLCGLFQVKHLRTVFRKCLVRKAWRGRMTIWLEHKRMGELEISSGAALWKDVKCQ